MQGKKQYEERLFVSFQLSDHVPKDNFYRRLKNPALFTIATKIIIVAWAMKQLTKDIYQRMHQRMQTKRARRLMKERSSTVEPVIGTLVNYLGMKKVNIKGLQQANKCMLLSATAYNIKKLLNILHYWCKPRQQK